jgi:tetratricopeptide (TPR) repeat protein
MHRKALELDQALGSKEGMAADYANLGNVYRTRGDLDKAEEMHRKSLEISEALGSKEGMAINYGNLGIVYKQRGNLAQAEAAWRKSLSLYQAMGHPNAKMLQQWLDKLAQGRAKQ